MTVVEAPARTPKPKVDKSTDFRQQGRLAAKRCFTGSAFIN